jgi:branched-chain amino acid transport system permease protein
VKRRLIIGGALLAVALSLPWWAGEYWTHVAIMSYFYVIVASSWNLLSGYGGQLSFAHVTFTTIGAYTSSLVALNLGLPPALSMVSAALMGALAGYLLGVLCLRMRGIYHSLTTLAFAEAFRTVLNLEYRITRGPLGLRSVPLFSSTSKLPYYFAALALCVAVLLFIDRIVRSPVGRTLEAIREDQTAASVVGVSLTRYKLFTWSVVAGIAGLGGAFLGHYILIVTPDWATQTQMALVIAMAIMGGLGTLVGPVLGAVGVQFLSEYLRVYGRYYMVIFGLALILMLRFTPGGVIEIATRIGQLTASARASAEPEAPGRRKPNS